MPVSKTSSPPSSSRRRHRPRRSEPHSKHLLIPDSRGRVTLGRTSPDVIGYRVAYEQDRIILEPLVGVPAREAWLYRNPDALGAVMRGLRESKAGKAVPIEDFSRLAADED
jgi:hypothetical protein